MEIGARGLKGKRFIGGEGNKRESQCLHGGEIYRAQVAGITLRALVRSRVESRAYRVHLENEARNR